MSRAAVALALVCILAADARALEHKDPELGYSFAVPDGWRPMTREALDAMAEPAKRAGQSITYVAGYKNPDGAPFPYLLVQSIDAGGVSVEELARAGRSQDEATRTLKDKLAIDMVPGVPSIDERRHCVVMLMELGVGEKKVKLVSYQFPGAHRALAVHCYAEAPDAAKRAATFEAVADSFRFDPGHEYAPRTIFSGVGKSALTGAVMGAVAGLVAFLAKKRSK